jgi:RimJ/RimL family protein N-acetyltransferase
MAAMAWQTTSDVTEFLTAAGPYLRAEPARNTVILSVTEMMRVSAAAQPGKSASAADDARSAAMAAGRESSQEAAAGPLLGWFRDALGAVAGAFMHTPPFPVVLTEVGLSAAAELAAVTLAARPLGGVNAYPDLARAFADGWLGGHPGSRVEVYRRQRLYRLGELAWPDPAPAGAARIAADADAPLAGDWFTAFAVEVDDMGRGEDQSAAARQKISHGGVTLWDDEGGRPVALACNTAQVSGMARIGPVYTPPEARGRGYGSAATAALSRRLRDEGIGEVVLYTDLANPVSNSIYQRIGYRPVEDRVVLSFQAG